MSSMQLCSPAGKHSSANISFQSCGNANQPKTPFSPALPALLSMQRTKPFILLSNWSARSAARSGFVYQFQVWIQEEAAQQREMWHPSAGMEGGWAQLLCPDWVHLDFWTNLKGIKLRGTCSLPCLFVYLCECHFSVAFFNPLSCLGCFNTQSVLREPWKL